MPEYRFATGAAAIAISLAVVLLAFLINRFAPKKRRNIRRSVSLALLYLLAFGAAFALVLAKQDPVAHVAREAAELLGVLASVNIAAMIVFDIVLPAIGIEIATILTDIAIGAAYIVAILATMRRAGVDFSGLVATSALLTTITAFSLQGTLSNIVGGVALQLDNSVKVGDWIQLENGKQGKVREVRWRYTVIETRDWDTMVVPNSSLLAGNITILGKREGQPLQHRMWVYFNVDFRFSPTDVIKAVNDALDAAPIEGVAAEPRAHAICYDLSRDHKESFAYYAIRYWLTDLARDDPTSSKVRERLFAALKRASIPLAIPGAHLWLEQDDVEHRSRKDQRENERRLRALGATEVLHPLHRDELERMAPNLRYAFFAPGETVTKQGAVAHWFYILVSGTVEVSLHTDEGDKVLAKIAAPGFFGEMGLMTGEPRSASVCAVTEVECYRVEKADFHRILQERPEIAAEISGILAKRRVELLALHKDLGDEAKKAKMADEREKILGKVRQFFGLGDGDGR
jgi:small-conductance mechanosensitive channel/CRP-like cAMP-binding protein